MRGRLLTIDLGVLAAWGGVDIPAVGAEELDCVDAGHVGAADGQDVGRVAEDAWAGAKVAGFVFLELQ